MIIYYVITILILCYYKLILNSNISIYINFHDVYATLSCLEAEVCQEKCFKHQNTRNNHRIYREVDYPHPFPYNYYFIHSSICPFYTFLFVYIISGCSQIAERISIRLSWGKTTKNVTFRFIIGVGKSICNRNYQQEKRKYDDIFQLNIYESFANETLFNLYTMKYLNELCPNAKFFAKIDADCYVDIKKIYNYLHPLKYTKSQFWGAEKGRWMGIDSNQTHKYSSPYFVAKYYNSYFPKKGIYSFSGFITLFSSDIPLLLYNYSLQNPILIRIDDQYLSYLLYKLKIDIKDISSYAIYSKHCGINLKATAIHRISSTDLLSFYIYMNKHK